MAEVTNFLPRGKADVLAYARQMHDAVTATGFDPASVGMTPADVTELGGLVTEGQAALEAANAARLEAQARTKDLSAPSGTHARLVAKLRAIANVARVSDATTGALAAIGVRRKKLRGTDRLAPRTPPEFSLAGAVPGVLMVRFRTEGSARPRARETNTIGVQIAFVNGATPTVKGEADTVPSRFVSSSPATLDSRDLPKQARLYARWMTQRGLTGPWSLPLAVSVI